MTYSIHDPAFSIIMPVFNRAHLICESLDSIVSQSFPYWQCIIVDDHSTDNTVELVKEYTAKDSRFKFYKRPPSRKKGANSCRNYGLAKSKGEYIHWFDSDDIAHPKYLEVSLNLLKTYDVDFCRFSRATFKGNFEYKFLRQEVSAVKKIDQTAIEKLLKNELPFNTCNVIWRRSSIGDQRFNENIVYGDEWEYYPRLLAQGLEGVSIENILFFGRKHANSTTYEFWNQDPVRRRSKIKAVKLVIDHLKQKDLLSPSLVKYFLQTGFFLKDLSIIDYTLRQANSGCFKKMKYIWGYRLYPIVRPFLKLKGSLRRF
ncbi:Glycosyltransferase involved in cell wall bisynthesis [Salinimicrobium catena]|uniref:Glycosyltransferase involved in cell wall bisynthesis n=1 Tax=Salinimicrobium catena TaxID=390640 RepID=A0A1H5NAW8_9FLAO|nr:glycosyltransferase family 2 protein [Salinimicrobium catena]SDL41209.1 Glycosyltransferase involved in cell wall bisynthesis [Salinimicrobium catena]SEE98600.1 Glycosyltransferase involved in cell wall bisynthesis [Salinimicrobium catena]